jgi:hypothetical protein
MAVLQKLQGASLTLHRDKREHEAFAATQECDGLDDEGNENEDDRFDRKVDFPFAGDGDEMGDLME